MVHHGCWWWSCTLKKCYECLIMFSNGEGTVKDAFVMVTTGRLWWVSWFVPAWSYLVGETTDWERTWHAVICRDLRYVHMSPTAQGPAWLWVALMERHPKCDFIRDQSLARVATKFEGVTPPNPVVCWALAKVDHPVVIDCWVKREYQQQSLIKLW